MKMIGSVGSIGSLPFKAGVVNLESADMAALIGAASGLVKVLIGVGAGALALCVIGAIIREKEMMDNRRISVGALSQVITAKRNFFGVLLEESLEFKCEGEQFNISFDRIHYIELGDFSYEITLIDDSEYKSAKILTNEIRFASLAGVQKVSIPKHVHLKGEEAVFMAKRIGTIVGQKSPLELLRSRSKEIWERSAMWKWSPSSTFFIQGASLNDIHVLRERLKFTLEHNRQAVVKELGEDVFNQYFRQEPCRTRVIYESPR